MSIDVAIQQANMGRYVFPCSIDKTPLTPHGCKDATNDKNRIYEWDKQYHDCQWGIWCEPSGLLVVDVDDPNTYELIKKDHPEMLDTFILKTGTPGHYQIWYQKPKGLKIKTVAAHGENNECLRGLPGVDIRADKNGYVIAPGCKNRKGSYIPINELEPSPLPAYLILLLYDSGLVEGHEPMKTAAKIIEQKQPQKTITTGRVLGIDYWIDKYSREARTGDKYGAGRNATGNMLATQLKSLYDNGDITLGEAESAMLEYQRNVDSSNEPYTEREALATLEYNFRNYSGKPPIILGDPRQMREELPPPSPPEKIELPSSDQPKYNLTDYGNAERLRDTYKDEIKYCYEYGKWLVWSGKYWQIDQGSLMPVRAKKVVRNMAIEAAQIDNNGDYLKLLKHAMTCESNNRITAMLAMTQSEVPIENKQLDTHKYKFNSQNYTLDLSPENKTAKILPHNKLDYLTKMADVEYNSEAKCPLWIEFLELVFDGNKNIINFMKRALGSCLTGDTGDQAFFILWGAGNNGKTTMVNTINKIFVTGQYCNNIPAESLMVHKNKDEKHSELADLPGIRFLTIPEGEEEGRLNESLIKLMTGNDLLKCRFLFHDFFWYMPQFKPFFYTNHKPDIRGIDHAIWRRIMLIPFNVEIVEKLKAQGKPRISNYEDILFKEEASGILNWLIEGYYEKIKMGGLCPPNEVIAAVNEYKSSMDSIQKWIDEQCEKFEPNNPDLLEPFSAIYNTYNKWAALNGEPRFSAKAFAKRLDDKGLRNIIGTGHVKFRQGVKIKPELLVTDESVTSRKFLPPSCGMNYKENQSLSVIGHSSVTEPVTQPKNNDKSLQTIIDSNPTSDRAERHKILLELITHQSKFTGHNASPLAAILDAMKEKGYSEKTIEDDIKFLKTIGEIAELPNLEGFYEVTK